MCQEKTEVTQGSGPRLRKSGGTLRELSLGGLEGSMRKEQGNKRKKRSLWSDQCSRGQSISKTPTGVPHAGKQGKQGRDCQIKILSYPKAEERAASLTPKKEERGAESSGKMCGSMDL